MNERSRYNPGEKIELYLRRLNEDTSFEIPQHGSDRSQQRIGWSHLLFNPLAQLFRSFLNTERKRSVIQGFIESSLEAISVLLSRAKRWEYRYRLHKGKGALPPVTQQEIVRLRQP